MAKIYGTMICPVCCCYVARGVDDDGAYRCLSCNEQWQMTTPERKYPLLDRAKNLVQEALNGECMPDGVSWIGVRVIKLNELKEVLRYMGDS